MSDEKAQSGQQDHRLKLHHAVSRNYSFAVRQRPRRPQKGAELYTSDAASLLPGASFPAVRLLAFLRPMLKFPVATFLTSAWRADQCPPDTGAEIAFAGRSNAGKSSALNAITGRKDLARTSKTPGRTQLINFFQLTEA